MSGGRLTPWRGRLAAITVALVAPMGATAQEARPVQTVQVSPKPFRWDENYAALCRTPHRDRTLLLKLKCAPLAKNNRAYVSLGGEYRLRDDSYRHPDFGIRGAPAFDSIQQRLLLHADVHLTSDVRAFVQFGAANEHGRKPASRPADRSDPDIAQAFVDVNFGRSGARWRLRAGRQEVAVGRYIAVRDTTNIRRTFDGLRLDGPLLGWSLTALVARATRDRPGAFDDDPDPRDGVALLVAERALGASGFKVDLAAIERDNDVARYAAGTGQERRRTLGVRLFGARAGWDADAQVSYQFGTFRPLGAPPLTIGAWGGAFEGGRTFATPWRPRLAVRIDAAGGDANGRDRRLGTFDLPYPNLSYLTDAALFAPRNVHDIQPFLTVAPRPSVTLTGGVQFLWRNTTQDAVYSPLNLAVIPPGGHGLFVGAQPYVRVSWRVTPLLELQGAFVHAVPGDALRGANARRDLDFALTSLTYRF